MFTKGGNMKTREEHLNWCKKRALEYIDMGDLDNAFGSMVSDLRKHKETESHSAIGLGIGLKMNNFLSSPYEMRKFILGFN